MPMHLAQSEDRMVSAARAAKEETDRTLLLRMGCGLSSRWYCFVVAGGKSLLASSPHFFSQHLIGYFFCHPAADETTALDVFFEFSV
jgi:hypothetical protein